MKDGMFEIGDEVECVDDIGASTFLTKGDIYKFVHYVSNQAAHMYVRDKNGNVLGEYLTSRFKLAEPAFVHEYFSALNEKDAEKYIGRTMEFADRKEALKNVWERGIFTGRNSRVTDYSFGYGGYYWQFCRTCPETHRKKMVKKVFERWVNIYKHRDVVIYRNKETAESLKNNFPGFITCIHISKEYEVKE
jgi:hypothetical protein